MSAVGGCGWVSAFVVNRQNLDPRGVAVVSASKSVPGGCTWSMPPSELRKWQCALGEADAVAFRCVAEVAFVVIAEARVEPFGYSNRI